MESLWLKSYPTGILPTVDLNTYQNVGQIIEEFCKRYSDRDAFTMMNVGLTFEELHYLSNDMASFFQNVAGLKKGDRIAIQMPNVLQYPIVLYAALKLGLVVVNTNPLYTAREMRHQFKDSGAKAIVILSTAAALLEEVLPDTDIQTVIVTNVGDLLGFPKSLIVNNVVKHIKKMVPPYNLPKAHGFWEALDLGAEHRLQPNPVEPEDLAFLQYTGGTTGVSKGAMLTHRNIIANMLQVRSWISPLLVEASEVAVCALPLYHIFSLTVNGFIIPSVGGTNVMVTNPRDLANFVKLLRTTKVSIFPAINTLYNALMNHPDFMKIDFSGLKLSVAGGMALQKTVAERWIKLTKTLIVEGYGLTETSPVATVNPVDGTDRIGSIGLPIPSTELKLVDENGKEVLTPETPGEICIRGPQVMKGYWMKPEETKKILDSEGWIKSGDVGVFDKDGFFRIVDRKKDMILVSGFNVYPNEVEEVVMSSGLAIEVAAIGVADAKSDEVVKVFIVPKNDSVTSEQIIEHCRKNMTPYKVPKHVEFRKELPKTNVGKILRRALREETSRAN